MFTGVDDTPSDVLSQEELEAHRKAAEEEAERHIQQERERKAEEEVGLQQRHPECLLDELPLPALADSPATLAPLFSWRCTILPLNSAFGLRRLSFTGKRR
jgi:hypothetical protein